MSDDLTVARVELRARQGLGARYDAPNAPARDLDWARRGTAYFARKLNQIADDDLWEASLIPGWTRRHVAACVGYNARALARVTERARTGTDLQMFSTPGQREEEIADGASLPAGALRHLVDHSAVHLNVEWRDLSDADWDKPLNLHGGPTTARETPWLRAKEVWLRAIELDNGGRFHDLPLDLLRVLVKERIEELNTRNPELMLTFNGGYDFPVSAAEKTLEAPLPMVASWLLGYSAASLETKFELPTFSALARPSSFDLHHDE